jgi:hypothetical protein
MTIMGRETGLDSKVLSVAGSDAHSGPGRCRDREIASFVSSDYFVLRAYLAPSTGESSRQCSFREAQAGLDSTGV